MSPDPALQYALPIAALGAPSIALGEPSAPETAPEVAPCMSAFLPQGLKRPCPAVVICPGGGYGWLANDHEGAQVARWFNARGVAAFVLHYRLGPEHRYPTQLRDAQAAMAAVRTRAAEWGVDGTRVGIMGFSAGGHLAASAATVGADTPQHRPDFLILGYPVITMDPRFTHMGTRENLLGSDPEEALVELLSTEKRVSASTPPAFIFHTHNDAGVPVENATAFYSALRVAGVEAEMHIYARGPHGVGLCLDDPTLGSWSALLERWLRLNGVMY